MTLLRCFPCFPFLLLLAAGVSTGCGSSSGGNEPAPEGVVIGPDGGEVAIGNCRATLTIPEDALSEEVEITVRRETDDGSDPSITSTICTFGPSDLALASPARLRFSPVDPAGEGQQNVVSVGGPGSWTELPSVAGMGFAVGQVDRLGTFAVRSVEAMALGGSSCEETVNDFTACGGDEAGSYTVGNICFTDAPVGVDPFRGTCPDATVEVTVDVPGDSALVLSGDDLDLSFGDLQVAAVLSFPASCTLGETCEALGCADDEDAGGCACEVSDQLVEGGAVASSYTVSGNDLDTDSLGLIPYCASDDGLTLSLDAPEPLAGLVGGEGMLTVTATRDAPPGCDALSSAFAPTCPGGDALCENVVSNGDFESADPINDSQPEDAGGWQGDRAERIAELDEIAACGTQMMRFTGTRPGGGSFMDQLSTVAQIVDLRDFTTAIQTGGVRAEVAGLVNRVTGDEDTDFEFRVNLFFSSSSVPTNPADEPFAARGVSELFTPGWQRLAAGAMVPSNTRSLAVQIQAVENVANGGSTSVEFDGHVIDDVSVLLYQGTDALPPSGFVEAGDALVLDLEDDAQPTAGVGTSDGWTGDVASLVGAENDVTPRSGSQMMRFDSTLETPEPSPANQSQVYRVVPIDGRIRPAAGGQLVRIETYVNRVSEALSDTQFLLVAYAFPGDTPAAPADFATDIDEANQIAQVESFTTTDDDPGTWEVLVADLVLPADTGYVAFYVAAVEDVLNNDAGDGGAEFDGHYADDFRISFLRPE